MNNSQPTEETLARLEFARDIALAAGDETLKLFRKNDLQVDRKADESPVTEADRRSEGLLRERIGARYPDDAILGEEFGETDGTSGFRWILDPIDGTKSFIHGAPLYTTLVALMHQVDGVEVPLLGVIHAPATQETVYAAVGGGCWLIEGNAPPQKTQVSSVESLEESLFLTTDSQAFAEDRPADAMPIFLELQRKSRLSRTWGDAYGYLMVACGRAEVMIDPELSLWDAAALQPIIQEAGGTFTDWQGEPTVHTGDAVASNGKVHPEVLAQTRGH